jgi:multiple sugar transport system permease protein
MTRTATRGLSQMERERRRAAFESLLPAVLLFGVYVVSPILDSIVLRFYDWDGMAERTFVGFGNYRDIRLAKSLFFVPFVPSGVVVGLVFTWFYDPTLGLLAVLLRKGITILGDERWVTFGIVFAALWPQTAYCMILYLTGLTPVNPSSSRPPASTVPRAGRPSGTSSSSSCDRPPSSRWW